MVFLLVVLILIYFVRESNAALCHGVALKKKKKRVRGICRRPREQYRSVSRGVVKEEKGRKIIGRGPRERFVAIPRFGINNALHGSKEHN